MDEARSDQSSLHIPEAVHQALQFVAYCMLGKLDFFILNYELKNKWEGWSDLNNLKLPDDTVPPVLSSLQDEIAGTLQGARSNAAGSEFFQLNADGNVSATIHRYCGAVLDLFSNWKRFWTEDVNPDLGKGSSKKGYHTKSEDGRRQANEALCE